MSAPEAPPPASFALDPVVARDFAYFSGGFWRGETRTRAWMLTCGLAASLLASTAVTVAMNHWNRWFFDALERKDVATVGQAVLVFAAIIAGMAAIGVCIVLTRETLQVRWRAWLVERLLARWLEEERFYRLARSGREPANPEYRISDDTRWATEIMVDLGIGLLLAVSGAAAFIIILATVGGSIRFGSLTIPAYMVWVALAYGTLASLLMAWIGRPLVGRVGAKNEAEGHFRFAMMRLRDNGESAALMGGGAAERRIMHGFYEEVVARWLAIVKSHGQLTWVTNASGPMIPIVPLLFAAPKYLAGELTLGQVTQLAAAFVQVQIAISWVVDNYNRIAEWYASARRVMDIAYAADAVEREETGEGAGIRFSDQAGPGLALQGLVVTDGEGTLRVGPLDLRIGPGEWVFLSGESSTGKSLLVRAVAGLWRHGEGIIARPRAARLVILPQRDYLPVGTLAELLAYPGDVAFTAEQMVDALGRVGLAPLSSRLRERARWDQVLSRGERQRLGLARVLLSRPDIVVLDDALSALDEAGQRLALATIAEGVPAATVLSLGQRFATDGYHTRHLTFAREGGIVRLVPATIPRESSRA
jgi:putative ATP-binding cassette transporter